jgi:acetyl esterase
MSAKSGGADPLVARATPEPDADTQALLAHFNAEGARTLAQNSPEEVRAWIDRMVRHYALDPLPEVAAIEDFGIPGPNGEIPVRLYRPAPKDGAPLPVVVFIHLGGYVFGNLDTLDGFCRMLAKEGETLVLAVDYRRAPEHRFPVPLEDCYAATLWASEHAAEIGADPARVAVAGDSSGGAMATITCQLAKLRGKPGICHQFLWYPGVGSAGPSDSAERYGTGYFLENELMMWSMKHYLTSKEDMMDHRVQPIRFEDMSGLPPLYLMTAGYDPRRDDNLAYARRMREAGVATTFRCVESTVHGFLFMLGGIGVAREAALESAHFVRDALR